MESTITVSMSIEKYNSLIPKDSIEKIKKSCDNTISKLEEMRKSHNKESMIYIVATEKINVYRQISFDLQCSLS